MADHFMRAVMRLERAVDEFEPRMQPGTAISLKRKLLLMALIEYVEDCEVIDTRLSTICNLAREVTR